MGSRLQAPRFARTHSYQERKAPRFARTHSYQENKLSPDAGTSSSKQSESDIRQSSSSLSGKMGRLYAIADLHLSHKFNLDAFNEFFATPTPPTSPAAKIYSKQDGLIVAGDVTERVADLRHCFEIVTQIFGKVWWVPGNHELYTIPTAAGITVPNDDSDESIDKNLRGEAKYMKLVSIARSYGVLTPEDEYVPFSYDPMTASSMPLPEPANNRRRLSSNKATKPLMDFNADPRVHSPRSSYSSFLSAVDETGHDDHFLNVNVATAVKTRRASSIAAGHRVLVCPIFTLYDYSFRPANVSREGALEWAKEDNVCATDEVMLHPDPYPTRDAWCEALVAKFSHKLAQAKKKGLPLVIINHWPLREDLVWIPAVPRFTLWCGTKKTDNWHIRYNAACVVTGHLHVRRTDWKDGIRFEEVSMGYPKQWEGVRKLNRTLADLVREIMPGPDVPKSKQTETIFRRNG